MRAGGGQNIGGDGQAEHQLPGVSGTVWRHHFRVSPHFAGLCVIVPPPHSYPFSHPCPYPHSQLSLPCSSFCLRPYLCSQPHTFVPSLSLSPMPVGAVVVADSCMERHEGRKIFLSCRVRDTKGDTLYAEATGEEL